MSYPVFDLHCDTAYALLGNDFAAKKALKSNDLHIDLDRASRLEAYAQCFACFTTPYMEKWHQRSPEDVFNAELQVILRELENNRDRIRLAKTTQQVEENRRNGIMSALLTLEGTAGIGYDAGKLEELYDIGFHIVSLGWNEDNPLTGSHITGGGLTDKGKAFVKEAQRLGMLIDVSHISDAGFWDIMDITQAPIIATHSNSRHICAVSRNLTDDMFLAICQTGGVAGFNQCDAFVGENPTIDTACRHFLHFLELDPTGKHIALGADLDGCDVLPAGFDGIQSYPKLAEQLKEYGLDDSLITDIFWNNAMGVMTNAVYHHEK